VAARARIDVDRRTLDASRSRDRHGRAVRRVRRPLLVSGDMPAPPAAFGLHRLLDPRLVRTANASKNLLSTWSNWPAAAGFQGTGRPKAPGFIKLSGQAAGGFLLLPARIVKRTDRADENRKFFFGSARAPSCGRVFRCGGD